MKLTKLERWMLSNQYLTLEKVDPDNAENYAYARTAIENGYEREYDLLIPHIFDETVSEDDCPEVRDTLEMFSRLQRSYADLEDKSGIDRDELEFPGYDGNNETGHMAYARYVCDAPGMQNYEDLRHGQGFNSHMESRSRYGGMLRVWREMKGKYPLDKDTIGRVSEGGR